MHLIAYLKTGPTALHVGSWRHPEATLDDIFEPSRYEDIARLLEAARFDGCFYADLLGLYDTHGGSFATYVQGAGQISFLDPMTVLPLMARVTRHLGLGVTLSTTLIPAYYLARMLASLDRLSGGRVAWNMLTSSTDLEAQNFGLDNIPPRELRYDHADEVVEACCALWDGWQADAFVLDKAKGIFADPSKVKYQNYSGRWVKTRGPLSIPRSPQDRPILMQAGASERGRQFAARWAELVFTMQYRKSDLLTFTKDIKRRVAERGRDPADCRILAATSVVIGETESIARERAAYIDALPDPEMHLASSSSSLSVDLSKVVLDEKVVDASQGNQGVQGTRDRIDRIKEAEGMTFAQVVKRNTQSPPIVGTPAMIADRMQDFFESGACDGFVITPNVFPQMYEQFCRAVVPELQRRGVFRREYAGTTLRENLRNP